MRRHVAQIQIFILYLNPQKISDFWSYKVHSNQLCYEQPISFQLSFWIANIHITHTYGPNKYKCNANTTTLLNLNFNMLHIRQLKVKKNKFQNYMKPPTIGNENFSHYPLHEFNIFLTNAIILTYTFLLHPPTLYPYRTSYLPSYTYFVFIDVDSGI